MCSWPKKKNIVYGNHVVHQVFIQVICVHVKQWEKGNSFHVQV